MHRANLRSIFNLIDPNLLALLLALARTSRATFTNDFSGYPAGAQDCLYDASNGSSCTGDTSAEMNACLCSNGGNFVINSAKCVAQDDPDDMESVWAVMDLHCSESNTPLSVSKSEWLAEKSSVSTSSASSQTGTLSATNSQQTTTVTATSTPASDEADDDDDGLSTGAKIGLIAGSIVAGGVLLAAAVLCFVRLRRRQALRDEAHPMLAPSQPYADIMGGGPVRGQAAHESSSMAPSELDSNISLAGLQSVRSSWQPSSDGIPQVPWSPGAFEAVRAKAENANSPLSPPLPEVYEMPADNQPAFLSPPVEMPTISVKSPMASPNSRSSGADWNTNEPGDSERYEHYRPK